MGSEATWRLDSSSGHRRAGHRHPPVSSASGLWILLGGSLVSARADSVRRWHRICRSFLLAMRQSGRHSSDFSTIDSRSPSPWYALRSLRTDNPEKRKPLIGLKICPWFPISNCLAGHRYRPQASMNSWTCLGRLPVRGPFGL